LACTQPGDGDQGRSSFVGPYWSPNIYGAYYTLKLGNFGMSVVISLIQVVITAAFILIVSKTGAFITDLTD
jgi:hypothetical protein